jgi:hypothetical protein
MACPPSRYSKAPAIRRRIGEIFSRATGISRSLIVLVFGAEIRCTHARLSAHPTEILPVVFEPVAGRVSGVACGNGTVPPVDCFKLVRGCGLCHDVKSSTGDGLPTWSATARLGDDRIPYF